MKNFTFQLALMIGAIISGASILLFLAHLFVGEMIIGLALTALIGYVIFYIGYHNWKPRIDTRLQYKPMTDEEVIGEGLKNQFKIKR